VSPTLTHTQIPFQLLTQELSVVVEALQEVFQELTPTPNQTQIHGLHPKPLLQPLLLLMLQSISSTIAQKKIIHACISWDEPATATFVSYIVNYRLAGTTGAPTQIATTGTFQKVSGLTPQTSYEFWIVGITAAGISSFDSSFLTVLTQESDAKLDPAKDITNVVCDWFNDRTPGVFPRREIRCSWTAAAPVQPKRIKAKVHCTSAIREPLFIRKSLYGADATATEVVFHTHRDVATCFIYLRAYYPKRPATRHVSVIIVGDDDS